jgi:hypothetical protein
VTRIQRRLLCVATVLIVIGTIVWIVLPVPALPATVWFCAATGELRETASGPALTGFETQEDWFPRGPDAAGLFLVRTFSVTESVRLRLRICSRIERPLHPMWPTGAKVADGAKYWEEWRVDPR